MASPVPTGCFSRGRPFEYVPATTTRCAYGTPPPREPGVYRFLSPGRTITYIGETNNLARRLYEHLYTGRFLEERGDTFAYQVQRRDSRCGSVERRVTEVAQILQHQPSGNRDDGGGGRIARR